jgi:hypothetical protein
MFLDDFKNSNKALDYAPEILHLILSIICLFYFFGLMFRFNELFGPDDVDSIVD